MQPEIPPQSTSLETLPERDQALAQAVALWLAGYSKRAAAREAGVARTTLGRHLEKGSWAEADRVKYAGHVEAIAFEVAQEAGRQLAEQLEEAKQLTPNQLAVVWGIAVDKIAVMRRIATPESQEKRFQSIVKALQESGGGKMTLEVTPHPVVDVTPGGEGEQRGD